MAKMSPDAQEFHKARIGNIAFVIMLLAYGLIYALQFVLDLTVLLSLIAAFIGFVVTSCLTLYLYMKGAYKIKKNAVYKQLVTLITFLIEIIPEVDLIPADVIDVVAMFIFTRIEDREIAEEKALAAANEIRNQQIRAMQYADYAVRQQQEQEEQIQEEEVAAVNDNKIQEAGEEEDLEEFSYAEAA